MKSNGSQTTALSLCSPNPKSRPQSNGGHWLQTEIQQLCSSQLNNRPLLEAKRSTSLILQLVSMLSLAASLPKCSSSKKHCKPIVIKSCKEDEAVKKSENQAKANGLQQVKKWASPSIIILSLSSSSSSSPLTPSSSSS